MAIKLMCLLKRKGGMNADQFRDYYENVHAPLAARLLPFFSVYRRNYLPPDAAPGVDVITEFVFDTQADYDAMAAALAEPRIAAEIAADEDRFLDRAAIRVYQVEVAATA